MNRFRVAREKAKLSQKSAAISIGVKAPSMSAWENGTAKPTIENLIMMASLYGVSVDYLLGVEPADGQDNQKEPTVSDDGLKDQIIAQIRTLPDPALSRVADFLSGLQAGRESAAAEAAAPDPDGAPAP